MADDQNIGKATMTADGTIILVLRAEDPIAGIGHAQFSYPPSHPQYLDVLNHLGGLRPGEEKLVPPWEDEGEQGAVASEPSPSASLKCPSCQTENSPDSRFCKQCGSKLTS
jgi:hypothetical protein